MDQSPSRFLLLLAGAVIVGFGLQRSSPVSYVFTEKAHASSALSVVKSTQGSASDSTGKLFAGNKIQTFDGILRMQNSQKDKQSMCHIGLPKVLNCDKWAVVTTINPPTSGVKSVASLKGWCMVIVGDTKTSSNYLQEANLTGREDIIFLSADQQKQMQDRFVQKIPFRSFARKNVGYLFAIWNGAKVIYDFDDDNEIQNGMSPLAVLNEDHGQRLIVRSIENNSDGDSLAFNPLPFMRPSDPDIWPRGFPVSELMRQRRQNSAATSRFTSINAKSVGVVQAVCDQDPDVDAIFRLTRHLPVHFNFDAKVPSRILVPPKKYSPYNAQATTHMYNAFWGLLLPFTVPGRVTDIWRSYITQHFLHELGLVLVYDGPLVKHLRSAHEYLADFQVEGDLYLKTHALLQFLSMWKYEDEGHYYLPARIERLTIELYERDYISLKDVYAMQEWLVALDCMNYQFPSRDEVKGLDVHAEPVIEDQPFLASPSWNVGKNGKTFSEEWSLAKTEMSLSQWMELNGPLARPSEDTILKLVLMSKNEWPLLKDWILYHGALVGFQNLYIIDGSTDRESISFLAHVRDHYGVSVIFSKATLTQIPSVLTEIARALAHSCDFIIKMDTDEFLAGHKGSSRCDFASENKNVNSTLDCHLSPYAMKQAANSLRKIATGGRLRLGWETNPLLQQGICDDPKRKNDFLSWPFTHGAYPLQDYKTICDARTCAGLDLGGHWDRFQPPVKNRHDGINTEIGAFHFHQRCWEAQAEQAKKVIVSQGFIGENDSKEEIFKKLQKRYGKEKQKTICSLEHPAQTLGGASSHKSLLVWQYLAGCLNDESHYKTGFGFANPDFQHFLAEARRTYR